MNMLPLLFKKIIQRLQDFLKTLIGKVILFTSIFIILGTFGFYFLESPHCTLFCSFYWTIITITTIGFGDITPLTVGGQVLAIVLAFFGVLLISLTLATIMETIIQTNYFVKRKFKKMMRKMDELILICGYNERIKILIDELRTEGLKFVLINKESMPDDWNSKEAPYFEGDPTNDQVLLEAGVQRAKKALISLNDDGDTLLAILSIQALNNNCYTIAEVQSYDNVQHFKRINCSQIICQEEIIGKILNITLLLPNLFGAYNELISMKGNEIYLIENIKAYENKIFEDVLHQIKEEYDALLIGFIRQSKTILNPKLHEKIQKGDHLLVISETFIKSNSQ
ncbi:MAG: potassium channel family protein [Candidatus Helarchaeota archaeon]